MDESKKFVADCLRDTNSKRISRIIEHRQKAFSTKDNTINSTKKSNEIFTDKYGEQVKRKITQTQKRLNNAEIASIIEEYKNGMSTYTLAEKYSCHRNTVSNHLKKHGIEVTMAKVTTEQDKQKIVDLYKGGLNTTEIAERFKVSYVTVIKYLHENGVQMRTRWDY